MSCTISSQCQYPIDELLYMYHKDLPSKGPIQDEVIRWKGSCSTFKDDDIPIHQQMCYTVLQPALYICWCFILLKLCCTLNISRVECEGQLHIDICVGTNCSMCHWQDRQYSSVIRPGPNTDMKFVRLTCLIGLVRYWIIRLRSYNQYIWRHRMTPGNTTLWCYMVFVRSGGSHLDIYIIGYMSNNVHVGYMYHRIYDKQRTCIYKI